MATHPRQDDGAGADDGDWRPPFVVGQVLDGGVTFTPETVRVFAAMAGDANPVHFDADWAARTRFGGLIASTAQTTSLLLGSLAGHIFPRDASLGLEFNFRLRRAVPATCVLTARWTVLSLTPKVSLGGVLVELDGRLFEDDLTYVEATATIAVMPHEALKRASGHPAEAPAPRPPERFSS